SPGWGRRSPQRPMPGDILALPRFGAQPPDGYGFWSRCARGKRPMRFANGMFDVVEGDALRRNREQRLGGQLDRRSSIIRRPNTTHAVPAITDQIPMPSDAVTPG